ncbi:MAG: transposase [Acidobacteria bacterium]|nr:transposase [Acidobacteriota bacterium]
MIEQLTGQICQYDLQIEQLCQHKYPETQHLQQIRGVGPVTAMAFVLTLKDAKWFRTSHEMGAFLGRTPRWDQDRLIRISSDRLNEPEIPVNIDQPLGSLPKV